jgi:hypothetical protein
MVAAAAIVGNAPFVHSLFPHCVLIHPFRQSLAATHTHTPAVADVFKHV